MQPEPGERERYYRSALRGLRFVEARRPTKRRPGAEAEARWTRFKDGLMQIDRIELLLRDAYAEWPRAPTSVVAAAGLAGVKPPRGLRVVHSKDADASDLAGARKQVERVS
jgi:hypothetical protein